MISLSAITSSYAQDADEQNRQLSEIKAQFLTIQKELAVQDQEATRILGIGLPDGALRADLKTIVENVIGLQKQLKDLGQELKILTDNMNINPLKPFKIIIHKAAKDAPPLTTSIQAGEILYFTVDMAATKDEDIETRLVWSIMTPDGRLSENLKKTENILLKNTAGIHSFGINTTGLEDGHYTVMLDHNIVEKPAFKLASKARFDIGTATEIEIVRLMIDDEKTGDIHQSILPVDAAAYLFSYYKTPADVVALTASYRVRDLTTGEDIFNKTGRRKNKPDVDIQRVGIRLDPEVNPLVAGHEYRFDISFADDLRPATSDKQYDTAKDSITFFYGSTPKRIKLGKKIATNVVGDGKYNRIIPKAEKIQVGNWYTATSSVEEMNVVIRLINSADKAVLAEKTFVHINNKDTEREQVTASFNTGLLKANSSYQIETVINIEGLAPVKNKYSVKYAKMAQPHLKNFVKVSGKINTPGASSNTVKEGKNSIKLDSTVTFNAAPAYPEGLTGILIWTVRNSKYHKVIKLDGSNNDWSFSFTPKDLGSGNYYEVSLVHAPSRHTRKKPVIFAAEFGISLPFHVSTIGNDRDIYAKDTKTGKRTRQPSWKGYAWLRDKVGITIKANAFPVTAKITVKATLKETGETLFSESKLISLGAKEDKELEWDLNQPALKFDLESIFPNIDINKDLKKTIVTEFTIDDGKGYVVKKEVTTTQWLYLLNNRADDKEYFVDGPKTYDNPLVRTIIPPAGMKGPFTSSLIGISTNYVDGLEWYYDPSKLKDWIIEVGAEKYKEDENAIYYRNEAPLLLTIEDSNGRQAAAYWREYSNSTSVAKEKEPEEE